MVGWVQRSFPRLSPIPVPSFSPHGAHPLMRANDTAFDRLTPVSPDCVLGLHATPRPSGGQEPPGRYTRLPRLRSLEARAFRLSPDDFPRARISVSIARLSTSRFSGLPGPRDGFGLIPRRMLRSACYPCCFSAAELPDRLPSSVRNPIRLGGLGSVAADKLLQRFVPSCDGLCSHEHPHRVGPGCSVDGVATPRPAGVCRLPLCLRFTVRRT
jgi:hypothetical protein